MEGELLILCVFLAGAAVGAWIEQRRRPRDETIADAQWESEKGLHGR